MAMFFYHVGINTLRSYQTEITLGNMSAKEKKVIIFLKIFIVEYIT